MGGEEQFRNRFKVERDFVGFKRLLVVFTFSCGSIAARMGLFVEEQCQG